MKNLIVYLSPIEKAYNIIGYSIQVARHLGLNIHYVYNIDVERLVKKNEKKVSKEELTNEAVASKKTEIAQLVEKDEWEWGNITAVYSVYTGSLSELFKTLSLKNHSELVLFPIKDEKISNEKSIHQVLDAINLPVWCFKADSEYRQVKTIVYGSDYKKDDVNVIKSLTSLAKAFEAKINVLHVYKSEKFKQQLIDAGLKDLIDKKIEYPSIEIHSKKKGNVVKGIASFCKKTFADLVVLMKKDKYFFQDLLRKTTIEKALKKIDLPILIFKK